VDGVDDLVAMVLGHMDEPCDLVAQSMGGLIAIKAALAMPERVRRLVLTGTSGGVLVDDLGGSDWRNDYRAEYPRAAPWIMEVREDLSERIRAIEVPALLLWGDRDEVSPIAVGERLAGLFPHASLKIVEGGGHDFPQTHSAIVAPLIQRHLQ
jgi:pimeloyl-ACP methyl ester carboxylesterase